MSSGSKIAIVTDGSLRKGTPVPVDGQVPFYVHWKDGAGMPQQRLQTGFTVGEFFGVQRSAQNLPGTIQPSPDDFLLIYESLVEDGARQILVLTVPESKSRTFISANDAAARLRKGYPDISVSVVDTGTTACGVEYMAEVAIAARAAGKDLPQLTAEMYRLRPKIELFLALERSEYLLSSGRVPDLFDHLPSVWKRRIEKMFDREAGVAAITAARARGLRWTPRLTLSMSEGHVRIYRPPSLTFGGAVDKLIRKVRERVEDPKRTVQRFYLINSDAEEEAKEVRRKVRAVYTGELVTQDEVAIALLAITGRRFVAVFCIDD